MSKKQINISQSDSILKIGSRSDFQDTLIISISGKQNLTLEKASINVENLGKDWFDYCVGGITVLGAIIAAVYTLKSIRKLYIKDEDKQVQINRLASIAEKIEAQNDILKESNQLMSKQVETLQALTITSSSNEASDRLVQIELEKRELEYRPKMFSNMFSTFQKEGSFTIENGGKPFTLKTIESLDPNIIVIRPINSLEERYIPENDVFKIDTITKDGSMMVDKDYDIDIICENEIGSTYKVVLNSRRMQSLRTATKIEH